MDDITITPAAPIAIPRAAEGSEPTERAEKPKKAKVKRGSHACVRCKVRKQRCIPVAGSACENCQGVNLSAEQCVPAPRVEKRKRAPISHSKHFPPSADSGMFMHPFPFPPPAFDPAAGAPYAHDMPPFYGGYPSVPSSWPSQQAPPSASAYPMSFQRQPPTPAAASSTQSSPTLEPREGPSPTGTTGTEAARSETVSQSSDEDDEDGEEDGEDQRLSNDAARGVAFLSINALGSPVYVGPSSGFSWARLILAGIATGDRPPEARHNLSSAPRQDVSSTGFQAQSFATPVLPNDSLQAVPPEISELILQRCFQHLQPRYPFMDWIAIHDYWQRRDEIMREAGQPNASKESCTAAFFIWVLFAIGARLCQKLAIPSLATPEAYYQKGMEHLEVIVGLHDLKNVQALMLMVMYAFRAADAPSVWFLVRIIGGLVLSLGLHRELRGARAQKVSPYILQLRKRIFWSAYSLDRMMSMSLGRPMGIPDRDIDISLPLNIDCIELNPTVALDDSVVTSSTSSNRLIEIKRIESRIQKHAYRVDRPTTDPPDELLKAIENWEARIPPEASLPTCHRIPLCSRDHFLLRGAEARLYLLRPLTVNSDADRRHVAILAQSAADACLMHKRLHQSPASVISLESLRSCFLCGLTLLHAVRVDKSSIPASTLQKAIRATSNTMFAYTQHFRAAQAFHDAFEDLSQAVLEYVERPEPVPASAPTPGPLADMSVLSSESWQNLTTDLPSMMNVGTQDDYVSLLQSLGVPVADLFNTDPFGMGSYNLFGHGASNMTGSFGFEL